jgi:WS/DGAT/MGAT family acyltransferase
MGEHLTPLDATFLELEEADDSAHMHIGAIMVFERPPSGRAPSREELCADLAERLAVLPRYSQRLSEAHTGGLRWPEWLEDSAFDLGRHVTRAALPEPGGRAELREWASGFFSQRLDRNRPLWEMVIVEGLEGGRWALASKTHHCMVDGVGSVDVGHLLLDVSPDGRRSPAARRTGPIPHTARTRSDAGEREGEGLLATIAHMTGALPLRELAHVAEIGVHGVTHPRESLRSARAALEMIIKEELHGAAHTSLNEPIGTRRRFEVVNVPLDAMREVKAALGGTVNDVALCITASGLRALLLSRGERLPDQGLRAMVPMNVRAASEHMKLGNRVSSLFVELPVIEADTFRRYREIVRRMDSLKSDGTQAAGSTAMIELAGLAPPAIHSAIAQSLYATRLFNLTITNVPGPQVTLYSFGSALREIHPLVPLAASHAIGVALVSYDGEVFFGVVADPDSVPDLEVMVRGMEDSVGHLLEAARERGGRTERHEAGGERGGRTERHAPESEAPRTELAGQA